MSDKALMHGGGESYCGVVPTKQPNQSGTPPAEVAEGRPRTKENTQETNPRRTPSRESGPSELARVRENFFQQGAQQFLAIAVCGSRCSPDPVNIGAKHLKTS
jgi:RNA-directed DNA polymerase